MSSPNPYEPPPIPDQESRPAQPLGDDEYHVPSFKSPWLLGVICMVFLSLEMLDSIFALYSEFQLYTLQPETMPEEERNFEAIAVWTSWQPWTYLVGILLSLTTSLWLIAWMYRCHRNLESLGHRELDSKHVWAVLCWFIPVLNLFCPFQVMREIWWRSYPDAKSSAESAPVGHLVFGWWLLRVTAVVTAYLSRLFSTYETWPRYYTFLKCYALALGCHMISAILCILIVHRISQWQVARYRRLQESVASP